MTLDADDIEQLAAAIAPHVVARLSELVATVRPVTEGVRYVDAATLARVFGVDRAWVYEHKHELGAIRLPGGGGTRGRLRFDVDRAAAALGGQGQSNSRVAPSPASPSRRRTPGLTPRLIDYDDAA